MPESKMNFAKKKSKAPMSFSYKHAIGKLKLNSIKRANTKFGLKLIKIVNFYVVNCD